MKAYIKYLAAIVFFSGMALGANTIHYGDWIVRGDLGVEGSATFDGDIIGEALTADSVILTDSNKKLTSSLITSTELESLSGIEGNIQDYLDTLATSSALANHILDTTTHGVSGNIVGTTDPQSLTNKTFLDELRINELTSSPSTPASGIKLLYAKDDGKVYTKDSEGVEKEIGSGAGGTAGKNYFVDPFYSDSIAETRGYIEQSCVASGCFDGGGTGYAQFTDHGLSTNDKVIIYGDSGFPSGLTPGQEYFAVVLSEDFVGFSLTQGGSVIAFTDSNTAGNYYLRKYKSPEHLSASVDTTSPLLAEGSLKISYVHDGSDATGEGVELSVKPIDREDAGKTLNLKVKVDGSNANYPAGDLLFKVIDFSNGKVLTLYEDYEIENRLDGYLVKAYTNTNVQDLKVSVHLADDNASDDWSITFGTFSLSPDSVVPGFIGGYLGEETWGDSWANATTSVKIWRRGSRVTLEGDSSITGVGATGFSITVPSKYKSASNYAIKGSATLIDQNGLIYPGITQISSDGSTITVLAIDTSTSAAGRLGLTSSIPFAWASGDVIRWDIEYEVSGWDDSAVFSTTELMNKSTNVTAMLTKDQNLTDSVWTPATFTSLSIDQLGEFNRSAGTFTPRETGKYTVSFPGIFAGNAVGRRGIRVYNTSDSVTLRPILLFQAGSGSTVQQNLSFDFDLVAGKSYRFEYYQESGGNLLVNTVDEPLPLSITRHFEPTVFSVYGEHKVAYIKDIKGSSTDGGTFTGGSWQTRTLNTIQGDSSFVSLSSNDFTLAPGQYLVKFVAPGYRVGVHKARLVEASSATERIVGSSAYSQSSTDYAVTDSHGFGLLTVSQATAFRLQHYGSSTQSSNGFGVASSSGTSEVYAQVEIQKIK